MATRARAAKRSTTRKIAPVGPTPIGHQTSIIRDLSRDPWFRDGFLKRDSRHEPDQFYVCLDVLEDTELALNSYRKWFSGRTDWGRSYLYIFGALQSLAVQQDALQHLTAAVRMKLVYSTAEQRTIDEVRDARIAFAGHPTRRTHFRPKPEFSALVRIKLGPQPEAATFTKGGGHRWRTLTLPTWIADQQAIVAAQLATFANKLVALVDTHRARHSTTSLLGMAMPLISALMAALGSHDVFTTVHARSARTLLGSLVGELSRRGLRRNSYDSVDYARKEILRRVADAVGDVPRGEAREELLREVTFLRDVLEEIDETYRSPWTP